ncbi:MAG: hypothetical protein ACTS6P_01370 [Candidatus Hodgkinia cicadicola]
MSRERDPKVVLASSKEAVAAVCKVSPSALTFALNVVPLLQALILSLLSTGDEAILCEHELTSAVLQVFTSLAFPVVVKGGDFRTRVNNILSVANPVTKLVYMVIPSNFRDVKALQHFRDRLPPHVTLVLDFGRTNFPVLASHPSAESKLTGNIIVLRTFPHCSPPLSLAWMHAKAFRISPLRGVVNPFTINKVTKTMMVNAINDFRRWRLQASGSLFWGIKVASQIRSNRLILREVQLNFVVLQLFKRLPVGLVRRWFAGLPVPIGQTAGRNVFNSVKFRLTSAAANSRSARALPSLKTMAAVVKTTCAHPFRPSPAVWLKFLQPPRHCEAFRPRGG